MIYHTEEEYKELQRKNYKLENEIDEMKLKKQQDIERIAFLEEANKHMLEIHKNRSNALREIRPKKERSGYIPISQEMSSDSYWGKGWKTIVETPYCCEMRYEEVVEPVTQYVNLITGNAREIKDTIKFKRGYRGGYWQCTFFTKQFMDLEFEEKETFW